MDSMPQSQKTRPNLTSLIYFYATPSWGCKLRHYYWYSLRATL